MPTRPQDFQRFSPIGNANRTFRVSVNDVPLCAGLNMKETLIIVLDKVFEVGITLSCLINFGMLPLIQDTIGLADGC